MAFRDLKTTTIREFNGGLNVVNDDLNMSTKYSKIETNIFNSIDGTKAKRYGTKFLKDLKSYDIVEETFTNVELITIDYLTLLYDETLNASTSDYIKFIHEDETESSSVPIFAATSDTITIKNSFDPAITEQGTIKKFKIFRTKTQTWSTAIDISRFTIFEDNTKITINKPIFRNIVKGNEVKLTGPEDLDEKLLNNTYTVTSVNRNGSNILYFSNRNTITLDITSAGLSFTSNSYLGYLSPITYRLIYAKEPEDYDRLSQSAAYFENRVTNNGYLIKKYKLKILTDNNSDLIAGHVIDIYLNSDYSGTKYTKTVTDVVIEEDDNLVKHRYILIDVTEDALKNATTLYVKHDNRNFSGDRIINCVYYVDKIISVTNKGEIIATDGQMNSILIWNDTIAKTVNPENDVSGWKDTTNVCFTVFNGILTVWNGVDKPVAIDLQETIPCNFLYDAGTGSNAFVPIAKYAISFNHYLVCGNIYNEETGVYEEDKLSISSRDMIGTFYDGSNDASNDAVELNLGTIISSNKQIIKGLSRYRDRLVIGFDEVSVFGTLGNYEEQVTDAEKGTTKQVHVPSLEDVIDNNGCICNRSYASINSELICLDYSGVPLFKRTGIYSTILPGRISELVAPEIYSSFINLTERTTEEKIFSIHNPKENQYLLFIPNADDYDDITEYICYAYTLSNNNKQTATTGAWSKFTGWNFQCGCTSALNDIYLINKTKIYQLGSINNPYYADYIDDPDYPATDTEPSGKAIEFEWEFPWADFGDRSATKHSRYLSISSTGTSEFCIDFFTDYIYYNNYYKQLDPQLTMDFVAGDSYGYGNGNYATKDTTINEINVTYTGKQNYGGGRITNNELLFAWTTKFKIAKFRIHGSSKYKLNINSITLYYQIGNIRR